jgi:DUF917 family protein
VSEVYEKNNVSAAESLTTTPNFSNRRPFAGGGGDIWELDYYDVEALSVGAAILGCGGGGSAYLAKVRAKLCLDRSKKMRIVRGAALTGYVVPVAFMGAPTVVLEKLINGREMLQAIKHLEYMTKARNFRLP